jgi:hypothetical protein
MRVAKCSCGALTAECSGEPSRVLVCNCLECQRRTGSVFGVGAYFPKAQVRVTGAVTQYQRAADSGRRLRFNFCGRCGTTLYWELDAYPDLLGLAVGAFGDAGFPPPVAAVWTQSKHEWVVLPETMAHHAQSAFRPQS